MTVFYEHSNHSYVKNSYLLQYSRFIESRAIPMVIYEHRNHYRNKNPYLRRFSISFSNSKEYRCGKIPLPLLFYKKKYRRIINILSSLGSYEQKHRSPPVLWARYSLSPVFYFCRTPAAPMFISHRIPSGYRNTRLIVGQVTMM